jgi:hypothetical protein
MGVLTRIYKFYAKNILMDPYYWFWAVLIIMFWLLMGAYVWGTNISIERIRSTAPPGVPEQVIRQIWERVVTSYTGGWYATSAVISAASIGTGLVYTVYFSSMPIRYLTKYSRASPVKLYLGIILTAISSCVVAASILMVATVTVYSHRFYGLSQLILPQDPLGVFITTIATSLLNYFIAMTLALLVVVIRKPGFVQFISFIPLMLGYGLGMATVYVGGKQINLSPYGAAVLLNHHYYTGMPIAIDRPVVEMGLYDPLISQYIRPPSTAELADPLTLWVALLAWILTAGAAAFILLRIQKGVGYEELVFS